MGVLQPKFQGTRGPQGDAQSQDQPWSLTAQTQEGQEPRVCARWGCRGSSWVPTSPCEHGASEGTPIYTSVSLL